MSAEYMKAVVAMGARDDSELHKGELVRSNRMELKEIAGKKLRDNIPREAGIQVFELLGTGQDINPENTPELQLVPG